MPAATSNPTEVEMSSTQVGAEPETYKAGTIAMKLEVVLLPVSDVDGAKRFSESLGWRLDADFATSEDFRVVQLTPPGSQASITFGTGLTVAAHAELVDRGVDISEIFHDAGGVFHHAGTEARVSGQEITTRLPGR
jgi:catechol 2,3-dioxygenase-like lactoylglutathione lyase family enzyme